MIANPPRSPVAPIATVTAATLPGRGLSATIVATAPAFDELRHEWDALVEASAHASCFLRWRWNALWWAHLAPPDAELRIVTCRDDHGRLVGLAPLYLRQRPIFGVPLARELLFLGTGIPLKTSEYVDVVAERGSEGAVAKAVARALNACDDWDRLWLDRVPAESPALPELLAAIGGRGAVRHGDTARFVDTSNGWDGYKERLGRSMRRNVEYYPRRLFKSHACDFRCVETDAEVEAAFGALVDLHVRRWASEGEIGSLTDGRFVRFLRETITASHADGRLRMWTLTIAGRIEAVLVGFLDKGVLHYFQAGYNPDFRKDDLGTVMVALSLRACCDDPQVQAFDFLGGGAAYKAMWARETRHTVVGEARRPTARSVAYDGVRTLTDAAKAFYRTLTPVQLRQARARWLNERRFRRHHAGDRSR